MRRLEYLLKAVRRSTDNVNTAAIQDSEFIEYYNDGQKLIQNLIFKSNVKCDLFRGIRDYPLSADGNYTLPDDIFAVNALYLVQISNDQQYWRSIDREDLNSRVSGYSVRDNILTIMANTATTVRVHYFKALPKFDKRWGQISIINANVSLVVATGDASASDVDDLITIVDANGLVIKSGLQTLSINAAGTVFGLADTSGIAVGQYITMGKGSTTVSGLPDATEPYLQDYVRKRLYGRNVYNDGDKQEMFTDEQKQELIRLFQNNTHENLIPPITDPDSMDF